MRKYLLICLCFTIALQSLAFVVNPGVRKPALHASELMISLGAQGSYVSLMDLSVMKRSQLEKLTGRKMNIVQRLAWKGAQKKIRSSIDKDGYVRGNKIQALLGKAEGKSDAVSGFHLGGFALGFLLGIIGIIVAYLIKDDKKSNRVKWAWIGFAIWVGIVLLTVVAA